MKQVFLRCSSLGVQAERFKLKQFAAFSIRFIAARLRGKAQRILLQGAELPEVWTRKVAKMNKIPCDARGIGRSLIRLAIIALAACGLALGNPAMAQGIERFDPNDAYSSQSSGIDGDLMAPPTTAAPARPAPAYEPNTTFGDEFGNLGVSNDGASVSDWSDSDFAEAAVEPAAQVSEQEQDTTYGEDDLIGAAEGVFGKGAEGLAKMIEGLLAKQGRPNGYIVGREAGGAFVIGARYGSGTLHHKVEGKRQVYWTGPSVGFDAGANAANTFVLVYNLYDSEELFSRFPAGEGQAYFIGGLHASYLRKGDVVLIPIRMGAGLRLGVNAGYMKFSRKQRWLPF